MLRFTICCHKWDVSRQNVREQLLHNLWLYGLCVSFTWLAFLPHPPFFFQQSWCGDMNVSEGSKTVETKLTSLMYAHLGWLKLQNAHICPDEQASWTVLAGCRLKKCQMLSWKKWNPRRERWFPDGNPYWRQVMMGFFLLAYEVTPYSAFSKSEWEHVVQASIKGERRFRTEGCYWALKPEWGFGSLLFCVPAFW